VRQCHTAPGLLRVAALTSSGCLSEISGYIGMGGGLYDLPASLALDVQLNALAASGSEDSQRSACAPLTPST